MTGHMKAERLEELRQWARFLPRDVTGTAFKVEELINAVDHFRAANAATNDTRNVERSRLVGEIRKARTAAEEAEWRADQDAGRRIVDLQTQLALWKKSENELADAYKELREKHRAERTEHGRNKTRLHLAEQVACASAFEHGRTLAEFQQAVKEWEEKWEDSKYDHWGEDV